MQIIRGLENLQKSYRNPVVTLGSFDGMHIGHQKVISKVANRAGKINGTGMVITFHPHPRKITGEGKSLPLLTTTEQKLELIKQLGIKVCLVINFDKKFSRVSSLDFVRKTLAQTLKVKEVFVGSDYRFGKGKSGSVDFLRTTGLEYGFRVNKVKAIIRGGKVISSTRIRQLVTRGELTETRNLLGRPYSLTGKVEKGSGQAGLIGYPTANFRAGDEQVVLPEGAYAGWIKLDGKIHPGMIGVVRKGSDKVVEAHFFDFCDDIYGSFIEVFFWKFLRGGKRFPDREMAGKQISEDERKAREIILRGRVGFSLQNVGSMLN